MAGVEYNPAHLTARPGDRRNCNLSLDTSPPRRPDLLCESQLRGQLLAAFNWTGHSARGDGTQGCGKGAYYRPTRTGQETRPPQRRAKGRDHGRPGRGGVATEPGR